MISGEIFSSICLIEPEFGSNAACIIIRISEFDEKIFLLKAKKLWIGNARLAGLLIVWV